MDSQVFAITLALLCLTFSEAKVTEVTVLKYDGLEGYHFHSVGQLKKFYTFQFCLCPGDVELQLNPSERHTCQCSPNIRGRSIAESYPHAVYSSACINKADSENCSKTTFTQGTNERLFVKVGVEEDPISKPEWQELSMKARNTYPIQTVIGGSIKLTYSTASQNDTDSSTEPSFSSDPEEDKETVPEILLSKRDTSMPERHNRVPKAIKSYIIRKPKKIPPAWKNPKFLSSWKPALPLKTGSNSVTRSRSNSVGSIRQLLAQTHNDRVNPLSFNVKQFKDELTIYHNTYRAKHGAPALVYDAHLEQAAQKYVNILKLRKKCLAHEQPRKYGENLFFFAASDFPNASAMARLVTESFYMEGRGYNYNSFTATGLHRTGHFTQLIWKSSRRMGVGVAITKNNGSGGGPCAVDAKAPYMIHVVIKYDPPGNLLSRAAFTENVRPPK
ncbi:unnamed protein product [Cylicocyclus nassatus]|uniref:SCP domain-containing protein n=1 Tax=Cylicocyclus nassatus TaxID=53992 RepID=A0AA36HGD3_CYLNA|nr:unnamed protein product [Cylicocyclus nassatus]